MNGLVRLGALFLAVALIVMTSLMFFSLGSINNSVDTIGVIGGADGPTQNFISGSRGIALMFIVTISTFGLAVFLIWSKSPKTSESMCDEEGAEDSFESIEGSQDGKEE